MMYGLLSSLRLWSPLALNAHGLRDAGLSLFSASFGPLHNDGDTVRSCFGGALRLQAKALRAWVPQLDTIPSVPHAAPQTARHPAGPSRRGGRGRRGREGKRGGWRPGVGEQVSGRSSGFSVVMTYAATPGPRSTSGLSPPAVRDRRMQCTNTCPVPDEASRPACRLTASPPSHR